MLIRWILCVLSTIHSKIMRCTRFLGSRFIWIGLVWILPYSAPTHASSSRRQARLLRPGKTALKKKRVSQRRTHKVHAPAPRGMVYISSGYYVPLYKTKKKTKTFVPSFYLDTHPVTNREFLAFVRQNPRWQRTQISPLFAGRAYLSHWPSALSLGRLSKRLARAPVTRVSWFPAKYYCKWKGKRLPTLAEWEYAASASQTQRNGSKDPKYYTRILRWYSRPTPAHLPPVGSTFRNVWGVYDLHGLIWEWVLDFQTALVTGESRGDSELNKQLFCGAGAVGASDFRNYAAFMRFAFRSSLQASYTTNNLGFRCAMNARKRTPQKQPKRN